MNKSTIADFTRYLQNQLTQLRANDKALDTVFANLARSRARAVIFGGWVRDQLLQFHGAGKIQSRDIDVVVDSINETALLKLLPKQRRINTYNGFFVKTAKIRLDIWRLESTLVIAHKKRPNKFESLPGTTPFRIESVIFKPAPFWRTPTLEEHGFFQAMEKKMVDFQCEYVSFPQLQACRAVLFSLRLGFKISPEVQDFISSVLRHGRWAPEAIRLIRRSEPIALRSKAEAMLRKIGETRRHV
jgi:hypothetical protein